MAKKKNGEVETPELVEVETIPERFKGKVQPGELYHLESEPNQVKEPEISGYKYYGCGDHGFYYVKN